MGDLVMFGMAAFSDHGAAGDVELDTGTKVTADLVRQIMAEEVADLGDVPYLAEAQRLFSEVALADDYADFLTLPAYEAVLEDEGKA